uniref:Uncharacterized protein n=1 Tax=Anopheles culicifacies TaxID=139723 RepID=A0A182MDT8_9DIPT
MIHLINNTNIAAAGVHQLCSTTYPVTSSKAIKSGSHSSSEYSSIIWLLFSELPLPLTLADDSVSADVPALVAAAGVMAAGASTRSYAGSEPDAVARLSSSGASAGFEIGRSSRDRLFAASMLGEDANSRHASNNERNDLGSMLTDETMVVAKGSSKSTERAKVGRNSQHHSDSDGDEFAATAFSSDGMSRRDPCAG